MKKTLIMLAALGWLSSNAKAMSIVETPWPEQVCNAFAVVVGTLSKINAHYISVVQEQAKPPYKLYYDSAQLEGIRVLKSRTKLSGHQRVIFLSQNQPIRFTYRPSHKFSEGDIGVWFLYSDLLTKAFLISRPYPMSDEEAIAKVILESDCDKRGWPNHLLDHPAAR